MNKRSKQIRRDTITLSKANGGYHYGGSFSCVEILIALYDHVMDDLFDKFVLSKGHACWPLYVILRERGLSPKLEGHPSRDPQNGIHFSTGSLGHGLPAAVGMAMAKNDPYNKGNVYCLMGDGECQEGTTWESMLIAVKYKLDNLIVIVDRNMLQGSGREVLDLTSLGVVAETLGWSVDLVDGHNIFELQSTLIRPVEGKPHMVIADTVKGKGVSFMENQPGWHARWPNPEEEARMLEELA